MIAVLLALAVVSAGCYVYDDDHNAVVAGNIGYVFFKQRATDEIARTLHYGMNHGEAELTLDFMWGWTKPEIFKDKLRAIGFYISDFDYFFSHVQAADFNDAVANVAGTDRCLVMHRNLNYAPWGEPDRHNWTFREDADQHCVLGKTYL